MYRKNKACGTVKICMSDVKKTKRHKRKGWQRKTSEFIKS